MCISLETPISFLLGNCSFLSFCWIFPPSIPAISSALYMHLSCLLYLLPVIPPPHYCHTNKPHTDPIDKHARVSTKPCSCNQKCTNCKDHMHGLWRRSGGSLLHSNTLRICKAALPISGTLLRAIEFWRGKTSSHIHWLSTITHPSTCHPGWAPHCHVRCSGDICEWDFNDHHDTRGIYLIEKWGRFRLVEEDQKWKVRLPRCKWGPRDTCETEIKDPPFLKQNILDTLF